jgi:hypothetical protein
MQCGDLDDPFVPLPELDLGVRGNDVNRRNPNGGDEVDSLWPAIVNFDQANAGAVVLSGQQRGVSAWW